MTKRFISGQSYDSMTGAGCLTYFSPVYFLPESVKRKFFITFSHNPEKLCAQNKKKKKNKKRNFGKYYLQNNPYK